MTLPDSSSAVLYSSANPTTVERHVAWMEQYGIDGVFYQRFVSTLADPGLRANRDLVLVNLLRSAERHGRKIAVAWDLSGEIQEPILSVIARDSAPPRRRPPRDEQPGLPLRPRAATRRDLGARLQPRDRDADHGADGAGRLPRARRAAPRRPRCGGCAVLLARPRRRLPPRAGVDKRLRAVRRHPPVAARAVLGRREQRRVPRRGPRSRPGAHPLARTGLLRGGLPGFSWQNLWRNRGEDWPLNLVPRCGGRFLWHQGFNLVDAGATTVYVAMFDEVDEGTAIFKAAETQQDVPAQGRFLSLDADGERIPSDWYLRVTGEIGRMLRGEAPLQRELPIRP